MTIKAGLPTIIIKISMFDNMEKITHNESIKLNAENDGYTLVEDSATRLVYQKVD